MSLGTVISIFFPIVRQFEERTRAEINPAWGRKELLLVNEVKIETSIIYHLKNHDAAITIQSGRIKAVH
jgi:hypothetical protein